jgi:hypothetical protein
MAIMEAVAFYRNEIPQQLNISRALEKCCNKLTKPSTEGKVFSGEQFLKTFRTLSALLSKISDENGNQIVPQTPWYEKKWANWTFISLGLVLLIFYTVVSGYDTAWQNANNNNSAVRPAWLLALVLLTVIVLAVHTALTVLKTALKEERQKEIDKKIADDRKVTERLINAASALRDYTDEKEPNTQKIHLQRFAQNFSKLPTSLFQKEPELGKILGILIQRLPKDDEIRNILTTIKKNAPRRREAHFLNKASMDMEGSQERASLSSKMTPSNDLIESEKSSRGNKATELYAKNYEKLISLLALESLDSIQWEGKTYKCPHLPKDVAVSVDGS